MLPAPIYFPESLLIGDCEYGIHIIKRLPLKGSVGYCDDKKKQIYLEHGRPHSEMLATLIHEVLHAFEKEYSISLTHPTVYKLEHALSDFLHANLGRFRS